MEKFDLITNAQVMRAATTADGTIRLTIDIEGTDDVAAGYFVILAREKAPIRMGVRSTEDKPNDN